MFFASKKDKLLLRMTNLTKSDSCRKFVQITKDNRNQDVGIIILDTYPLIQIELYYYKGNKSVLVATIEDNVLNIGDMRMQKNNIGCGSIAMKTFLSFANDNSYSIIKGWLSPVDSNHFDRLEHFYNKFGFKVTFNENRTEGNILLEMVSKK